MIKPLLLAFIAAAGVACAVKAISESLADGGDRVIVAFTGLGAGVAICLLAMILTAS